MINLPNSNYTWFPVKKANVIPLYFDLASIKKFASDYRFTEKIGLIENPDPITRYRLALNDTEDNKDKVYTKKELESFLKGIHFTPILPSESFNKVENRTGLNQKNKTWLMAERFYWNFATFNSGSSRHVLLKNFQLKGAGKNPMATRPDDSHSWGGSFLWSNLKGLSFNILYKGILPCGIQKVNSVSLWTDDYQNKSIKPFEMNSVVARDASSYRLAQLMSGIDPDHLHKNDFIKNVGRSLPKNYSEYLNGLYHQYGLMLTLGICNLNFTKENVMVDGSLIDYEDVSYRGDIENQTLTVKLYYPEKLEDKNQIEKILDKCSIYLSDYHMYLDAIKMSQKTYNKFFESNYEENLNQDFFELIKKIKAQIYNFSDEQLEYYKVLSEHTALYRTGSPYFHLSEKINAKLATMLKKVSLDSVVITEADDGHSVLNFNIPIKKGNWVDQSLHSYYQKIRVLPVDSIATPVLKLTDTVLGDRADFSFENAIQYSSQVNKILSKSSWLAPYQLIGGDFKLVKYSNIAEVKSAISKLLNISDYEIVKYNGIKVDEDSVEVSLTENELNSYLEANSKIILQGIDILYSDLGNYYVPFTLYLSK